VSKKEYAMIAAVLHRRLVTAREVGKPGQVSIVMAIADTLAGEFQEANPRFDKARFMDAVLRGGEKNG
jgi:hypothetical protein